MLPGTSVGDPLSADNAPLVASIEYADRVPRPAASTPSLATYANPAGGPLLTVNVTFEPGATLVSAAGLWLRMDPEATTVLECGVTVPTVRPTTKMLASAAASELP